MSDDRLTRAEAEERLGQVYSGLAEAAARSGRAASEIKLLAVSKTFPSNLIRTYLDIGQIDFGESYIQEARIKIPELNNCSPQPNWHFIGHLQTNKAKYAVPLFETIHSLDNLELARELDRRSQNLDKRLTVYVQVNVSGEESKTGLSPAELPYFLDELVKLKNLLPAGLMTMPPYDPDPELSRPFFAALRELRDKHAPELSGLSMGMSGDYQVAVEEGATIVRVGSALFGARY